MHSEAIGSVWTCSKNFEIFLIFESFFNFSGRNVHKRLFHSTIVLLPRASLAFDPRDLSLTSLSSGNQEPKKHLN